MCPITKSAKKALRQNKKRKVRNFVKKTRFKKLLKELGTLVSQEKFEKAKELLPKAYKALDKAAKSGVIKEQKAGRKKSQIAKMLNKSLSSVESKPTRK